MATDGECLCHRFGHKFEDCDQFLQAGYCIEYNPTKAKEKRQAASGSKKKSKKKSHGQVPESTPASGAAASSTPAASPPQPPSSTPVGGAAHASTNQYAALESDDESGEWRDVGSGTSYASAVARNSNTSTTLYPTVCPPYAPSVCIGSSSHVAASQVTPSSVVIADSGATDHMWPHYSAFTSYKPLTAKHVTLADNTLVPVVGIGSIKILFDGHVIGVRNVLHVPSLRVPLYSLRAHRAMLGCGFIGNNEHFHIYFPTFVATVNDTVDSHVDYSPLGPTSSLPFEFRQPRSPSSTAAVCATTLPCPPTTVIPFFPDEVTPHHDQDSTTYDTDFPP